MFPPPKPSPSGPLDTLVWHPSVFTAPDAHSLSETLPHWLAKAAARWPDRPAVLLGEQSWTYADLARRAAGLAVEIDSATSTPGPVALVQSVGLDAIASWFACAMAGRAFLLLEPDHPPARLRELIEAAACPLVLCDHATSPALEILPQVDRLIPGGRPASLPAETRLEAHDPAMIFPTSGSTGVPKLVTYSATTLQVKAQSSRRLMQVPEGARVVIAGSHANYGFLHHACVFLLSGGALCLADLRAGGFAAVLQAIDRLGARHVRFTPSMFRAMAALPQARSALRALDAVRFSGEPLLVSDLDLARSVVKPACLIQNVYGSTESALFIWSSSDRPSEPDAAAGPTVPIGRLYPLASYALVPLEGSDGDDSTGALVIRSAYHALGDFRAGEIDQTRFPPCPGRPGERLHATGDIVRRLPDGQLVHLGRDGRMVKMRGHRVFLAEIEHHLRALAGITGAAVVERVERDSPVLYAFITTDAGPGTAEACRDQLAARLPPFMLPRAVSTVSRIPLMPGGKVDYPALLAQLPERPPARPVAQAATDDHGRLVHIWDSILWTGAHAHDADFLSLGGDSLKLMTLSLEIERAFGRALPLEDFLADSTLTRLAALLDIDTGAPAVPDQAGLQVRQVWPGRRPARGIALAMPGWHGKATAVPFGRAGLFPDHDLWAADYGLGSGSMRESQRWWRVALAIVEHIRSGAIPRPRIVFGYSFGGGLAWLVSRLLAGTPHCPEFVIMVDAAPLHRLPDFRPGEASRALARVSHVEPPPTLHIRREPLAAMGFASGSTSRWQAADRIGSVIELPTIDHLEMAQRDMLVLAARGVQAFLSGQSSDVSRHLPAPDIEGVRWHQLLSGRKTVTPAALDELIERTPARLIPTRLTALLHLSGQLGQQDTARALIDAAVQGSPHSKLIQYVRHRRHRAVRMLCPQDMPGWFPSSLAALDRALAGAQTSPPRPAPRPVRLLCLAVDASRAVFTAHRHRYADRLSAWVRSRSRTGRG